MGVLSKVWKGIKKTVKKIGKGIKKVVKKIGGAIGKLGIVGQIGMMFLMPYAINALSGFFGTAGTLSGWSQTLLNSSNVLAKGLGHGLNVINKAGSFVGDAYRTISGTISEAFDRAGNFFKGRGFTKTPVVDPKALQASIESGTTTVGDKAGNLLDKDGNVILNKKSPLDIDTSKIKIGDENLNLFDAEGKLIIEGDKNFFDMSADDFAKSLTTDPSVIASSTDVDSLLSKEPTFLENINIFDKDSAIRKDIAEFDVYEFSKRGLEEGTKDAVFGGLKLAGTQAVAKGLGYEPPEAGDYFEINLPGMASSNIRNSNVYNEFDFTATKLGNPYIVSNVANSNYLNSIIGDNSNSYNAYMAQFAASQYSPVQFSFAGTGN